MKQNSLFVYGTLLSGFSNYNKYLEGWVVSVEKAYVRGELYHLYEHGCPALLAGSGIVHGEFIRFNDDDEDSRLASIDAMEKFFDSNACIMYERKPCKVWFEDGREIDHSAYFFTNRAFF